MEGLGIARLILDVIPADAASFQPDQTDLLSHLQQNQSYSYVINNLTDNETYLFRVSAYDVSNRYIFGGQTVAVIGTTASTTNILVEPVPADGFTAAAGTWNWALSDGSFGSFNDIQTDGVLQHVRDDDLIQRGNPLDLAIRGAGFFQVQMPDGTVAYTRSGAFKTDNQGMVVTTDGNPISPMVVIPANSTAITVGSDGSISVLQAAQTTPIVVGTIMTVAFPNPAGLSPYRNTMFLPTTASGAAFPDIPGQAGLGTISQGFVETVKFGFMVPSPNGYNFACIMRGAPSRIIAGTINPASNTGSVASVATGVATSVSRAVPAIAAATGTYAGSHASSSAGTLRMTVDTNGLVVGSNSSGSSFSGVLTLTGATISFTGHDAAGSVIKGTFDTGGGTANGTSTSKTGVSSAWSAQRQPLSAPNITSSTGP
jgi:hypothetical protein